MASIKALSEKLKIAGYKLTQPRRAVLQALAASREHQSAEQLHRRAKAFYKKLGLVTVYRTLELLSELGLVRRVHLEGGCHSYTLASRAHSHQLICRGCGRVEEFSECALIETIEQMARRTGYAIETHWLELSGRCSDCRAA